MHLSSLTSKGQTTIPLEIREYLNIKPHDKIVYVPDGDRIFLSIVRGTILDLKGSIKSHLKKPIDFPKLRDFIKNKVSREALGDR